MKLVWQIEDADKAVVKALMDVMGDHPFVQKRREENLAESKAPVTRGFFWSRLVLCLLSTQQRSGPGSATARFAAVQPFPLSWRACSRRPDLAAFVQQILTDFGGIRRAASIGRELGTNRGFVETSWAEASQMLDRLGAADSVQVERDTADYIQDHLKGFGPKQSRNLLQALGLTRYEIPIDSRITRWLNDAVQFPVKLTATALGDRNYYQFVCEGFQQLSAACGTHPCILDAAIFASYDRGKQDADGLLW
jgi:hypothetical protein